MKLAEAIAHAEAGGRATCDVLPRGAVLKTEEVGDPPAPQVRVIWEATGSGYTFTAKPEYEAAEWHAVTGWASYG
ncbi:hypothetical protein UFOVP131_19 [uncultured Caudovirales phage]|uniref:Uncharacterized protein n=1 Tax=uncultured Caudovirales phage TaxID=2100421 RepID=A0A6J5LAT6_9CAUD|nr:hypothetical protein UFOVP131_19 [uncultured Caudovirales phage]